MKISKINYIVLILCASISMTGCYKAIKEEEKRLAKLRIEQEKIPKERKQTHNKTELGTYDGCKVSFHSIHEKTDSFPGSMLTHKFYIAKCKDEQNDTTTTTEISVEQKMIGKYIKNEEKITTTITQ